MASPMLTAKIIGVLGFSVATLPALAASKCQYGSWNEEVANIAAMKDSEWQYRELKPDEQQKVVDRYWSDSHEKIDYPHAWIERSIHDGLAEYSVIFTDNDGCIQFHLNVTGMTSLTTKRPANPAGESE
jgi:hypothetical protein